MNSKSKEIDFKVMPIDRLKNLFSASEHSQLVKYGGWANSLETGETAPSNEKQLHFVDVCRGASEPETNFEIIWLRYRELLENEKRISELEGRISYLESETKKSRKLFFEEHEKYKMYLKEKEDVIKKLEKIIKIYEIKLGLNEKPKSEDIPDSGSRTICPNCGGDGGAAGQCYKCDGTGWVFVKS